MKTKLYAVVTTYSFDDEAVVKIFPTEKRATEYAKQMAEDEYRIDTQENGWDSELRVDLNTWELVNHFDRGDDVTKIQVVQANLEMTPEEKASERFAEYLLQEHEYDIQHVVSELGLNNEDKLESYGISPEEADDFVDDVAYRFRENIDGWGIIDDSKSLAADEALKFVLEERTFRKENE